MSKKKVISFSGGRTSAYLVNLMRDDPDARFVFMDTGAEHPATYEFVRNVVKHFGIELTCLRVDVNPELGKGNGYKVISIDDIRQDLKPWAAMIEKYGVPYVGGAFCTDRMKLGPFTKYCNDEFGKGNFETWLGIRADEPNRLTPKHGIRFLAEISDFEKRDILNWWSSQDFDLGIDEWNGNCVFCMKKSDLKLAAAQRDNPSAYLEFVDMLHGDRVRVGDKAGSTSQMYRKKRSLEQLIATFDGFTGEEIKERTRGARMMDSGSCSESCEVFSCSIE